MKVKNLKHPERRPGKWLIKNMCAGTLYMFSNRAEAQAKHAEIEQQHGANSAMCLAPSDYSGVYDI